MNNTLILQDSDLIELSQQDSETINGGHISSETSFAHDIFYCIGVFLRSAYEMGKAARGNPHI